MELFTLLIDLIRYEKKKDRQAAHSAPVTMKAKKPFSWKGLFHLGVLGGAFASQEGVRLQQEQQRQVDEQNRTTSASFQQAQRDSAEAGRQLSQNGNFSDVPDSNHGGLPDNSCDCGSNFGCGGSDFGGGCGGNDFGGGCGGCGGCGGL